MNNKNDVIRDYLDTVYTPLDKRGVEKELFKFLDDVPLRSVNKADVGKRDLHALLISSAGKKPRESFVGFSVVRLDVWKVGDIFFDGMYRDADGESYTIHIARDNPRVAIIVR